MSGAPVPGRDPDMGGFRAPRVVVVDQVGKLVRLIGGPEEGPGEFSLPRHLAAMEDGRVVVGDIARDRAFQVYGSDGDFDRNVRVGDHDRRPDPTSSHLRSGTVRGPAPRRRSGFFGLGVNTVVVKRRVTEAGG